MQVRGRALFALLLAIQHPKNKTPWALGHKWASTLILVVEEAHLALTRRRRHFARGLLTHILPVSEAMVVQCALL